MTSPTLPVLYSFRRCPYAIRARMALRYANVAVTVHEVALRQKPAALLAASPKGTVPVLVTPGGEVIDQSLNIMRWALSRSDPDGWLQAGDPQAAQTWITLNDETFKPLLDRYKYAERHPEMSAAKHRAHALQAMIYPMEAQLQQARWLLGPHISIADVALFPFVRQFASVDKTWFGQMALPAVQTWLNGWLTGSLFNAVMDKNDLKQPPNSQGVWVSSAHA